MNTSTTATSPAPGTVLDAYRMMRLIRRFDERALDLRLADRIDGVIHLAVGQEAVPAGVCAVLRLEDKITSTHRGHGHCLAKGADPRRMMAELFGRSTGYCKGKGGSMHIADFDIGMLGANGIVGAGLPIALGAALAGQLDGRGNIGVCFFGDGAVGAGPFHETMNIAATQKIPILFVCENNGWASIAPTEGSLAAPASQLAAGYGVVVDRVDGNDFFAVRDAADRAVSALRNGDGPHLIEAVTYRMSPHAIRLTPLPDSRDAQVIAEWKRRDPIAAMRRTIAQSDGGSEHCDRIDEEVEILLDEAISFAEESPLPLPEDALEGFYA